MDGFTGFPSRSDKTAIPNAFFSDVLPLIDDDDELRVSLHLFRRLALKKGYVRFVTQAELAADLDLMAGLARAGADPAKALANGLEKAVARGVFLHLALEESGSTHHLYWLNTDADRRAVERVRRGEIDLGAMPMADPPPRTPERRDIFSLYEAGVGVVSPLIADELKDAEEAYPSEWIVEAFREAQRLNKRSWRYVQRILENWERQGGPDGEHRRRTRKLSSETGAERKEPARRFEDVVRRK